MTDRQYARYGCLTIIILYIAAIALIASILCGCSSARYIPVETVRTEFRDRDIHHFSSDTILDSRVVFIKGDTIIHYRDRYHTLRVEVHDTLSVQVRDSIPIPFPVERPLTRWEQTKLDFGGAAIGALAAAIAFAIILFVRWLKRK